MPLGMHPIIPPHSRPPISNLPRSLEHPLPHDLRFGSQGSTSASDATSSVPQIVNAYTGDSFSPGLHPQFISGTRTAAGPSHLSNAAPCLLSDLPPAFGPADNGLKSGRVVSPRSCETSGSSFSTRGLSTGSSRVSGSHDSSSGSDHAGDRRTKSTRRRSHRADRVNRKSQEPGANSVAYPQAHNNGVHADPRLMLCGPGMTTIARSMGLDGFQHPGNPPRGSFPPGSPQLYGYPSPMLGHQPPPLGADLSHPQFGGMLSSIAGLADPTGFGGAVAMFSGTRGGGRPAFHPAAGGRFMVEGSAPHLVDESLPTYPNAAAAPNRLPAHKPVRLTQPKHPLAPPGTPVYFKYGEEHYPEETVPPEYTFTETDGTVCRYITNFLVYNKRGERLLPIEVLDQPRHAALVLYGSLLPAAAMSQAALRSGKREEDDSRGKKRSASGSANGLAKRQMGAAGGAVVREGGRKRSEIDRWVAERGGAMGGVTQTYPVRVELAEWCIDYGQEPANVPFIWLISRWDVYYRLEKPAGRYIPTFATAKMKFEVSTRVIKTLQYRPDTEYRILVGLLTAATRHERCQKKIERRAQLKRERQQQQQQQHQQFVQQRIVKQDSDHEDEDDLHDTQKKRQYDGIGALDGLKTEDSFDGKCEMPSTGLTKKKNRNWRIQSLSTPQGTGVVVTDEDGRPQATTPWGAPYAVDGFKESMLLGLAEFLESQLRNFMEGVGGAGDAGCPNLLTTPFMRTLRERTALRMETLQLMEAKKRALELARSLAEAASGHAMSAQALGLDGSLVGGGTSGEAPDYLAFQQQCHGGPTNGYSVRPPAPGYFPTENAMPSSSPYYTPNGLSLLGPQTILAGAAPGGIAADGIQALESEIRHLQQLLRDSEDDSEGPDDPGGLRGDSDDSSSEFDRHESRLGGTHRRSKLAMVDYRDGGQGIGGQGIGGQGIGGQGMYADVGFRLSPDGETNNRFREIGMRNGELFEPRSGPRCLVRSRVDDETIPLNGDECRPRDLSSSDFSSEDVQSCEDRGCLYEAPPCPSQQQQKVTSALRRGEFVDQSNRRLVDSMCMKIEREGEEGMKEERNKEGRIKEERNSEEGRLPPSQHQDCNGPNRQGALGEFACLSEGCPERPTPAKMANGPKEVEGEGSALGQLPPTGSLHECMDRRSLEREADPGKEESAGEPFEKDLRSEAAVCLKGAVDSSALSSVGVSSARKGGAEGSVGFSDGMAEAEGRSKQTEKPMISSAMSMEPNELPVYGGTGPETVFPAVQPPIAQPPISQQSIGQPPMGQPPMGQPPMGQPTLAPNPHLFAAFGFPFLQGFPPPPSDGSAFAGSPLFPFGGLPAPMGHPFLPFPPAYMAPPPAARVSSKRHHGSSHRADERQHRPPSARERSAEPPSASKKRKAAMTIEGAIKPPHGATPALAQKKAKTSKSPKIKSTQPSVHITMPPFPRDVADDLDVPVTDLRYYRAHLPLDRLEPFPRMRLVEIWDFVSTMADWLGWPELGKMGFDAIGGALGFGKEIPGCPSDVLMAVLLRFYCRRFEKLRSAEVTTVATTALHEFELAATNDASNQPAVVTAAPDSEASATSGKSPATTDVVKAEVDVPTSDPPGHPNNPTDVRDVVALTAQVLPYRSWVPSSMIAKQPAQVLTSKGWVNAVSSYAPLEVLLTQPTIQVLQRLAEKVAMPLDLSGRSGLESPCDAKSLSALEDLAHFWDQALELWSRKSSSVAAGDKASTATETPREVDQAQTDFVADDESVGAHLSDVAQNGTQGVAENTPQGAATMHSGPASVLQLVTKSVQRRTEILKPPRLTDLSFGLAAGIQWWRDEGSIDELTWQLYCRLALWDALCDVPIAMTRRRGGGGGEAERPLKKRKVRQAMGENGKGESPAPSTCEEGVEMAGLGRQGGDPGQSDDPSFSLLGEDEEPEGTGGNDATSDAGSVDETIDQSDELSRRCFWAMDERKASSNGVAAPWLRRMENLLRQLNGVQGTGEGASQGTGGAGTQGAGGIGWYGGLTPEDRSLILSWMILQLARSTLGRDMVERQADVFAAVKALIVSYDRPAATQLKVSKTQKSPGAKKGKPKKSPRSAKALPLSTETTSLPVPSSVANVDTASAAAGTPPAVGLQTAKGSVGAASDDVQQAAVVSPRQIPTAVAEVASNVAPAGDCAPPPASDEPSSTHHCAAKTDTADEGPAAGGENVGGDSSLAANAAGAQDVDAIEASSAGQDVRESETSSICPNAISKDVAAAATMKQPRQYSRRTLTKSELVSLLETASVKFRIRRTLLGEDRYFNRYFLFSTPNGKSHLFIEYHVLIPTTDTGPKAMSIEVLRKQLPSGVAAETDINQEHAGATESPSALLSAATSAAARLKRLTARGRPRKLRAATGSAGELRSEELKTVEGDDWVAGGKSENGAAPKGSGATPTVRRSGRTTKGQRKEPLYLDEFSSEEGDVLLKPEEFEEKKIKGKAVVSASFLSPLSRKMDGALFWRRPLQSQLKLKFLPLEAYDGTDDKLKGSLILGRHSERVEETQVVVYEGPYHSPSKRHSSKSLSDAAGAQHGAKMSDGSLDGEAPKVEQLKVEDEGEALATNKESEESAVISKVDVLPVLQWGVLQKPEEIRQLATCLSSFTIRERNLKAELLRLLDTGAFQHCDDTAPSGAASSDRSSVLPNDDSSNWRERILRKLALFLAKVTGFYGGVIALTVGSAKQPDTRRLRDALRQLEPLSVRLIGLPDNEFVIGLLFLLRSTLLLMLSMARLLRSVPAVGRVVTPVPASGWNGRSSPIQWENELKALDWCLTALAVGHLSSPESDGCSISVIESIFVLTLSDPGFFSKHSMDVSCHSNASCCSVVSSVLCDVISCLALYFSLWIRFGLNRPIVEYLLASKETQLDGLPQPGNEIVLMKPIYLQSVQELKASGVLIADECLSSTPESEETLRVLQVWLERLNGREPCTEAGTLHFKERPGFAREDDEVLLRMRCCLAADWALHGDAADDFIVVVPAEGFSSHGICLQSS